MQTTLLLLLLSLGVARSDDAVQPASAASVAAEHVRLSEEMHSLARRQAWKGVERSFRQLEALGVPPELDDLLNGALAARELGEVQAAYDRLSAAVRLQPSKEIVDWLWDIDANYGHVRLSDDGTGSATLTIDEFPFDPAQARAVQTAIERIAQTGRFEGALPAGNYTFAGTSFQVQVGREVSLELPCKRRCKDGRRQDAGTR